MEHSTISSNEWWQLAETADHEAGHAIVACEFGYKFGHVTIQPDIEKGYLGYITTTEGQKSQLDGWLAQNDVEAMRRYAIFCIVGQAATSLYEPFDDLSIYFLSKTSQEYADVGYIWATLAELEEASPDFNEFLKSVGQEARDILCVNEHKYCTLVDALMEKRTLSYDEVMETWKK